MPFYRSRLSRSYHPAPLRVASSPGYWRSQMAPPAVAAAFFTGATYASGFIPTKICPLLPVLHGNMSHISATSILAYSNISKDIQRLNQLHPVAVNFLDSYTSCKAKRPNLQPLAVPANEIHALHHLGQRAALLFGPLGGNIG